MPFHFFVFQFAKVKDHMSAFLVKLVKGQDRKSTPTSQHLLSNMLSNSFKAQKLHYPAFLRSTKDK